MSNYLLLTQKYFQSFADQNISSLSDMFDDNITLADWTASFNGKSSVIQFNKSLFDVMSSISVTPRKLAVIDNTVFAEITVTLVSTDNQSISLNVVDVIEYQNDKITCIRAYKC